MPQPEKSLRLEQLNADARKVIDAADEEKRELTEEETAQVDQIYADYDTLKAEIVQEDRRNTWQARQAEHDDFAKSSAGRVAEPTGMREAETGSDAVVFDLHGTEIRLEPGTQEHSRASQPYQAAFGQFLSTGVSAGLHTGDGTKGGYITPMQTSSQIIQALDDAVFVRQIATVLPAQTNADSLGVVSLDSDPADADWTAEVPTSDITEDDSMALGKRLFTPHLLTKLIKVSEKLLRTSVVNAEAMVRGRLVHKFAVSEEKGFLTGSGSEQPLGVFTASADGVTTARDQECASATVFTADELIDMTFSVKPGYASKAAWVCHRDFIKRARKLKDGEGQYLWSAGLGGQPATLLDRPYHMSEHAPNTFTTGQYIAMFGDFSYYWIVDSLSMTVQRLNELFSLRNQVGLKGSKETDGMPVLAEAFSRMKLG